MGPLELLVSGEDANGSSDIVRASPQGLLSGRAVGIPSGAGELIEVLSPANFLAQACKASSSRRKSWSSDCSMRTYVDRMLNDVVLVRCR
jgi:hypothetical protein